MQKRPWWRDLPPVFAGLRRYHVPLGAAAVLALTVVAVRNYVVMPVPATPAPGTGLAVTSRTETQPISEIAIESSRTEASSNVAPLAVVAAVETDAPVENSSAMGFSSVIPLIAGTLGASPAAVESTPLARSMAANLAAVETAGTRMLLGRVDTFEARLDGNRSNTIEPLQQMTSPAEVRLARYRSPLVATISGEPNDRTGERIARRISDDRLYDQISRIGARGDRVQVRF
ncbi:MAG: hypothetical protein Q7S40_03790 [Opitutaceae bacterium]|nr:hypothetical protein [Opitutaceae bacterium]